MLEREGVITRKHGSGLYVSAKNKTRHIAFCRNFFPGIIVQLLESGLIQACASRKWILTTHQFQKNKSDLLAEDVRADGIVVLNDIFNYNYDISKTLLASETPLVELGGNGESMAVDLVTADEKAAFSIILKKLASLGHRRIAYLNSEPANNETNRKLADFKNLTGESNLAVCPVIECHTQEGQYSVVSATHAMHEFLDRHPKILPFTAIISCSSPGSIAAMRVLHEHGWRIPQDCSVICMQEDPIAPYVIPAITNLKWDYGKWGDYCIELIEKRLDGEASPGKQSMKIVPDFNWRESVDKAPPSKRNRSPSKIVKRRNSHVIGSKMPTPSNKNSKSETKSTATQKSKKRT